MSLCRDRHMHSKNLQSKTSVVPLDQADPNVHFVVRGGYMLWPLIARDLEKSV